MARDCDRNDPDYPRCLQRNRGVYGGGWGVAYGHLNGSQFPGGTTPPEGGEEPADGGDSGGGDGGGGGSV